MFRGNNWLRRKLKQKPTMSPGAFWSDCGIRFISYFCAVIVMLMVLSTALAGNEAQLNRISEAAAIVLAVLWCIPVARNTRFRLRDAGYTAKAYLWLLLPVIGWTVFLALLLVKGKERAPEEAEHMIYSWDG